MKKNRSLLLSVCLLGIMIAFSGCSKKTSEEPEKEETVQEVLEEETEEEAEVIDAIDSEAEEETVEAAVDEEIITKVESAKEVSEDEEIPNAENLHESEEIAVISLFQSDILNPDCLMEFGEAVASIEIQNISGEYINICEIDLRTTDGNDYKFIAEDIPEGVSAVIFDKSNLSLAPEAKIQEISCNVQTTSGDRLMSEKVKFSVEGVAVSVTNITSEKLENMIITCHSVFDGTYFGGTKYDYTIDVLDVGKTVTISAEECYLGEAAVSSIGIGME